MPPRSLVTLTKEEKNIIRAAKRPSRAMPESEKRVKKVYLGPRGGTTWRKDRPSRAKVKTVVEEPKPPTPLPPTPPPPTKEERAADAKLARNAKAREKRAAARELKLNPPTPLATVSDAESSN